MMSIVFSPCLVLALVLIILVAVGSLGRHKRNEASGSISIPVSLLLDSSSSVASVDENFVCATLDWWPREKCNYGSCSWDGLSILNLDLGNPSLQAAVTALSPLLIRLGGSLEDQIVYDVGNSSTTSCLPFTKDSSRLKFSGGCLNMSRWQELNAFFVKTGSVVAFGLNSLYGRKHHQDGHYSGPWNPSNSREFIKHTVNAGYKIKAWELGNEISGDAGIRLDPIQYASDVDELKKILIQAYDGNEKPILVAPDGFFDYNWYNQVLKHTKAVDAVSVHVYNLGPGDGLDVTAKILRGLSEVVYQRLGTLIKNSGARARAWIGEAGGLFNGGQPFLSDTFVFSFWYLDQLGMAAFQNVAVFCRQTLVGGNYGLLDSSFNPNPDFYAALLWQKLMGKAVLKASTEIRDLHTYSHCLKSSKTGVAILFLNFSNTSTYAVSFPEEIQHLWRLEYHLTAPDGNLRSQQVMLNGRILSGVDPMMTPKKVGRGDGSTVAPLSLAFVVVPDALLSACTL